MRSFVVAPCFAAGAFALVSAITALAAPAGCCSVHSEAGNPAFSPDGRTLVFAAEDNFGPANLMSVDLKSGVVRNLTPASAAEAFPAWSPDGTRLAFLRGNPDTLWVMNADGSSRRLLAGSLDVFNSNGWALAPGNTSTTVLWGRPSWSPDGSTIAFTGPDRSIRTIDLATGVERRLAAGDSPVLSPDGSRIAFLREFRVWVIAADGTEERPLGPLPPAKTYDRHPEWSRDSRRLVFERTHEPLSGRPPQILVADLVTGEIAQPWHATGRDPTWSPEGGRLVFADRGVEVLDVASGELLHLTDHVGADTEPTVAPDGRTIAFTAGRSVFLIGADGRLLRNAEKLRPGPTDPAEKPACEIGPESPFGLVCLYGGSVPYASAKPPLSLRLNHINSAYRGAKGWSVGAQIIVLDERGYRVRDARVSVVGVRPGFISVRTILPVTQTAGNARFGFWSGPRLHALERQPRTAQLRVSVEGKPVADLALYNPRYRAASLVYATVRYPRISGVVHEWGTLWIARIDGSNPRRLTAGLHPAISPDGNLVAFFRGRRLYVVESYGGTPKLLARKVGEARWSPDSRRIAAAVGRALVVIDMWSGRRVIVDRALGGIDGFGFSPTGEDIVWARRKGTSAYAATDLYRASSSGSRVQRLTWLANASDPVWGPGQIAFARFEDDPRTAHSFYQLWLSRPDGRGARRLARDLVPAAWSRDGRVLLGIARGPASWDPFAVDPSTGSVRQLIRHSRVEVWTQTLSTDGRFVLASVGGNLVRLSTKGGPHRVLVRRGNRYIDESADWNL